MKSFNQNIAGLFNEIADLMSLLSEDPFRIRAYREAARRISQEIKPITKKTTKNQLTAIPRIGEALAEKIIQYINTGKIDFLEKLRKQIPKPVRDLLNVPHLGPARVRELYINLGIKSMADLKKYAANGKIAELPGFGEKLVKQILDAVETGQAKKKRHARSEVAPIAKRLADILKKIKGVKKITLAGSYRRKAFAVGDLDILAVKTGASYNNFVGDAHSSEKADPSERLEGRAGAKADVRPAATDTQTFALNIIESIRKQFPDMTVLAEGETKIAFVIFPQNLQVDIRFVPEESYGAALLYFTGSKDYNVTMRKIAIEKGFLLNEYGLFKDGEYIAGATEKEVFSKLGMPMISPEKRK